MEQSKKQLYQSFSNYLNEVDKKLTRFALNEYGHQNTAPNELIDLMIQIDTVKKIYQTLGEESED
jgi:hypothetical protein